MEKAEKKLSQKHKTIIIFAMIMVALIGVTSWSGINLFTPISGDITGGTTPTATPFIPENFDFATPTPAPTRFWWFDDIPTPTPTRSPYEPTPYLNLYMSPNPATQRDEVLGQIWSSYHNVEVLVHYFDYTWYTQSITLDDIGYGHFNIGFKTGSYEFYVTYGSLESAHVTLVVTA